MMKKFCDICKKGYWTYENKPDPIKFTGLEIIQKGRTFYIVKLLAKDLDRMSFSPILTSSLPNKKLAKLVLSPEMKKWQREINDSRLDDIGKFFNDDRNYFVNASIISIPVTKGTPALQVSRDLASFNIECDWVRKRCDACGFEIEEGPEGKRKKHWFDYCPNHECPNHLEEIRPCMIIDGQHRIRGTQNKYCTGDAPDQPLVATILTNEFGRDEKAKIFTEITTSAQDLDPLHKVFLLYKFKLRAPKIQQIKDPDFRSDTPMGKRNRRAYEISSALCSKDPSSKWHDRITILRDMGRGRRGDIIEASALIIILEKWLKSGGVFEDPARLGNIKEIEDAYKELNDYLNAILNLWPGLRFWNNGRDRNGIFQERGIFYVILNLFEVFAKRIDKRGVQRSYPEFQKELELIKNINWGAEWVRMRAPERDRNLLLRILRSKIKNAPLANNDRFGPIRGIDGYISKLPENFTWKSPTKRLKDKSISAIGAPIEFKWNRPLNSYDTTSFYILQENNIVYRKTVKGTSLKIDPNEVNGLNLDPSASDVKIQLVYTNPMGDTVLELNMKP